MGIEDPELQEVLREAIRSRLLDVHVSLPARIETYDSSQQRASIQPLLRKKYKKETQAVSLPVINNVPVQWPSANSGKAFIHLPLKTGDLGLVIFSERSLDLWLSGNGAEITPNDPRHHDLSDAIFIPGIRPFNVALQNISADDLLIENDKSKLSLSPNGDTIIEGGQLKITIDPSGKISIQGATAEMLTVLSDMIGHVAAATIIIPGGSSAGTYSLDPATIALLTADKAKLDTLKI